MYSDGLTIVLGFIEGFVLIISPCILPILPIFLASSLTGSKNRPVGIIVGFSVLFAIFAYFSRQLVAYSGLDLNYIRYVSYGILCVLGLMMVSTYWSEKFSHWTQGIANAGSYYSNKFHSKQGFIGGFVLGSLLALIWTPCAGPILAAIIVQTATQKTTIISFFTLLSFALGACVPMVCIAFFGRQLMNTFSFFRTYASWVRTILGLLIIASVVYMMYQERATITGASPQTSIKTASSLQNGLWRTYPMPQIGGIKTWINSPPLTQNALKGKVVLIDFWTYSCINCIRTLPYLKDWYTRYHDKGLVIIGIHTPEFEFEKNVENVKNAVTRYGIKYPVALDNEFVTWQNFSNHYWPAEFLVDTNGRVVYEHFGEGDDEVIDNNIRYLLGINDLAKPLTQSGASSSPLTPETYLGYDRADTHYSPNLVEDKNTDYHFTNQLPPNAWELQGGWQVFADRIVSTKTHAALKIHFQARKVYVVMGSTQNKPIKIQLVLNGKSLPSKSNLTVSRHTLYEIIELKQVDQGILELMISEPGLEIYTFTFGR